MYKLNELPYSYEALEPYIDTHTLGLHHNKHQKNYLNNLNKILKRNNYSYNYSIEELVHHINEFPLNEREDILFNLGGVLNHNIYFNSMKAIKILPSGDLEEAINKKYGSYEKFLENFKNAALLIKGSGYTFLVADKNKDLKILNVPNQETPYMFDYIPLIGLDMWEHAYYINYKNNKSEYIDNFFEIINFDNANKLYN